MKKNIFKSLLSICFLITLFPNKTNAGQLDTLSIRSELNRLIAAGDSLLDLWQPEKAISSYDEALKISRYINDNSGCINLLLKTGNVYYEMNQSEQALTTWREALELAALLDNKYNQAVLFKKIGWIYDDRGDYKNALSSYQQCLDISREIGDDKLQGQALNNIGIVCQAQHDYPEALEYFSQSLDFRRQLKDLSGEGRVLNNIGMVYDDLSEPDEALRYYEESLAIWKVTGDKRRESRVLGNIGVIYKKRSDYSKALEYYRRSLEIKFELGDKRGQAVTLNNIGIVYDLLSDPEKALEYYLKSLDLGREIDDRPGIGKTLDNIGVAYRSLHEYDKAISHFNQSLEIKRSLGDIKGEGSTLNNIGISYFYLKDYIKALDFYQKDLDICRNIEDKSGEAISLTNIGHVYIGMQNYSEAQKRIEDALVIATKVDLDPEIILAQAALGRCYSARGIDSLAVIHYKLAIQQLEGVRQNLDNIVHKSGYSARASELYESLVLSLYYLDRIGESFAYAEQSRARSFLDLLASAEIGFEQSSNNMLAGLDEPILYADASASTLRLNQIQALLYDEITLIEYCVTAEGLLAWIITKNDIILRWKEISREDLEAQVSGLRDAIINQGAVSVRSKRLYVILFDQLKEFIQTDNLIIVPHGILHYLPFQALQDNDGEYLIDKYTISYLPSASTLQYIESENTSSVENLLALGNPLIQKSGYTPIPRSEDEVQSIGEHFTESTIYAGQEATEDRFITKAPEYRYLHLACHSDLNAAYPMYSGLLLAPGEEQDGELDVHEIFNLKLNADLVVLSGCQTATGSLTSGDEIVGLTRAFIAAGSPTVISSLWLVVDESTMYLMNRFYNNLKHFSKAEALKRAQIETREIYTSPLSWASFVLIGKPD